MSSVNGCKAYLEMWLCSRKHVSNLMRGSSFEIITLIGLTASHEEKGIAHNHADLSYMCDTYTDKGEACS
jgi:hypothetical protein